jgi:hypothetical protein
LTRRTQAGPLILGKLEQGAGTAGTKMNDTRLARLNGMNLKTLKNLFGSLLNRLKIPDLSS